MKIIYKEYQDIDYSTYQFPYCIFGTKELNDTYSEIYNRGFLPYTNDLSIADEIYYMARSVRVDLNTKLWNYKQRNVLNKLQKTYEDEFLTIALHNKADFISDKTFQTWCLDNAKNGFLSSERLEYILSRPYLQQILCISYKEEPLAYLFVVHEKLHFLHVWYSFYDLSRDQNDFGKWILLKTIGWCKESGFDYFYIGTCYSRSALYKLTLSPFTTYWNGSEWCEHVSELKKQLLLLSC